MNTKQLTTLWTSIGIIVVMLLFPPWQFRLKSGGMEQVAPGPYHFMFLGPPVPPVTSSAGYLRGFHVNNWCPEVNQVRLISPIVIVVIVAGGLMVTFRSRE
jgi:hypothetical protein